MDLRNMNYLAYNGFCNYAVALCANIYIHFFFLRADFLRHSIFICSVEPETKFQFDNNRYSQSVHYSRPKHTFSSPSPLFSSVSYFAHDKRFTSPFTHIFIAICIVLICYELFPRITEPNNKTEVFQKLDHSTK